MTKKTQKTKQKAIPSSVVLVGRKRVMAYVLACVTFFHSGSKKVILKARGRAIPRAVDTVELLRRKFVPEAKLKSITIGTEQLQRQNKSMVNVSTIEIVLEV